MGRDRRADGLLTRLSEEHSFGNGTNGQDTTAHRIDNDREICEEDRSDGKGEDDSGCDDARMDVGCAAQSIMISRPIRS